MIGNWIGGGFRLLREQTRAVLIWSVLFALLGIVARAYGSYGWQQLTGLEYVHPRSDLDLLLEVATGAQADRACAHLRDAQLGPLRLDGELAFDEGGSVAWREWLRFRSGETDRVLVKRIAGTTLEDAAAWVETP